MRTGDKPLLYVTSHYIVSPVASFWTPLPLHLVGAPGKKDVQLTFQHGTSTILTWTPEVFSFGQRKSPKDLRQGVSRFLDVHTSNSTVVAHSLVKLKTAPVKVNVVRMNRLSAWSLYAVDVFDGGEAVFWNETRVSTCGKSSNLFLGGHCKVGSGTTLARHYSNLPPHHYIRLTALLHFFDKWLGESLIVSVDHQQRWTRSYHWCDEVFTTQCMKHGLNVCGNVFPDQLSSKLDIMIPHTSSSLILELSTTLKPERHPCEVSWGVDDVALYLRFS